MPYLIHVLGHSSNTGTFASFWSASRELGPAIAAALEHTETSIGLREVRLASAEFAEFESGQPEEAYQTATPGLWSFHALQSWNLAEDPMPSFRFPTGVVPTVTDEGIDPETIHEAYHRDPDGDLVEVVVDGRRLLEVYLTLFNGLPARDGFEIRLMHHWLELDHSEVWIGHPRLRDDAISDYLGDNLHALVHNGGVAVSTYSRDAKCTLRITDHKLITLYSASPQPVQAAIDQLASLGFPERDPMRSIAVDCEHYHFAPPQAPTAEDFRVQLQQDFRLVRTISTDDEDE